MAQLTTYSVKDIDSSKIEKFAAQLRGKIVMPSDDNYDEARKVFNAMIDKRPGMFAMCTDVADVIASVNFARENELTVSIMAWYDEFIRNASDDLNGFIATLIIPGAPFPEHLHNKQFCGIVWCYAGDMNKAKEVFEPILAMNPLFDHVGEMPYPDIQTLFDGLFPPGLQWYWRADFFNELGSEIGKQHLKFGSEIPTALSQMHLYPISGAASRVGAEDTPWAYRDAKYAGVIVGVDPDPANKDKITNWCKDYWEALHLYSSGGAYSNFMMDEGQERVEASYKHNYKRLSQIKKQYDPENLFRINQNINPQ